MKSDDIRAALAAALGNVEPWTIEVAARNAVVRDNGTIHLPTYIGLRDIAHDGARRWLDDYAPKSCPVDLLPDVSDDATIGDAINARTARARFPSTITAED